MIVPALLALGVIILALGIRLDDAPSKVVGTILASIGLGLLIAYGVTLPSLSPTY